MICGVGWYKYTYENEEKESRLKSDQELDPFVYDTREEKREISLNGHKEVRYRTFV